MAAERAGLGTSSNALDGHRVAVRVGVVAQHVARGGADVGGGHAFADRICVGNQERKSVDVDRDGRCDA